MSKKKSGSVFTFKCLYQIFSYQNGDKKNVTIVKINKSCLSNSYCPCYQKVAEQKITYMEAHGAVRKEIIQLEWEHRVLDKKIEDLHEKKKEIKMLRLSKEDMEVI